MFVLDTNVLSELMKNDPHPPVAQWIGDQRGEFAFTTAISKAEILAGIADLPVGRRRQMLEEAAGRIFERLRGRVLAFDDEATRAYADILASRRLAGRPIATADLIIAAIAPAHGATIVTRDIGGFELTGVTIVNPWDPT